MKVKRSRRRPDRSVRPTRNGTRNNPRSELRHVSVRGEKHGSEPGTILIVAILALFVMGALTALAMSTAESVSDRLTFQKDDERLIAIGESILNLAVADVWGDYLRDAGGAPGSIGEFRTYLDTVGITSTSGYAFDIKNNLSLVPGPESDLRLAGAVVHEVGLTRDDGPDSVLLRISATLGFGPEDSGRHTRTVERGFFIAGAEFKGFEFGLLANNVNCIMCHARFDNVYRYYNRDPEKYGTWPRVRVGTLESLLIRSGSADSTVAGTVYTRGHFMDKDGTLIENPAGTTMHSVRFTPEGNVHEDGSGALEEVSLLAASGDPLPTKQNLYLDYPVEERGQVDGPLPESFPPIIPDDNGNRIVDPEEFEKVASKASGTLSGGIKVKIPLDAGYPTSGMPVGMPLEDQAGDLSKRIDGNLVLRGTADNPIVIDGKIAVDGDVIIEGVVKGSGQIVAGGNMYVMGPVVYADGRDTTGARTFGKDQDGNDNRLTLGAGGNILVGDFLLTKDGGTVKTKKNKNGGGDPTPVPAPSQYDPRAINGDKSGGSNFTTSELTLFNRMEWTKTQPFLPDASGKYVANPLYEAGYRPRYYTLYGDNPVYVFNTSKTYFSAETGTWLGKEHVKGFSDDGVTEFLPGSSELRGAAISTLMPRNGWVSDTQLIEMWKSVTDRQPSGRPLELDALLYTNNATMFLSRKNSVYGGKAIINGGLVGADMGVLVPGDGGVGLQVNYDVRQSIGLKLRSTDRVRLTRGPRFR